MDRRNLEAPGHQDHEDVGLPPVHDHAVIVPFLVDAIVAVVVVIGGHRAEQVLWEAAAGESYLRKGPLDSFRPSPLVLKPCNYISS